MQFTITGITENVLDRLGYNDEVEWKYLTYDTISNTYEYTIQDKPVTVIAIGEQVTLVVGTNPVVLDRNEFGTISLF